MVAKSWNGPTVTARCANCTAPATIRDPAVMPEGHDGRSYCPACERLVSWIVWDGPVMPV